MVLLYSDLSTRKRSTDSHLSLDERLPLTSSISSGHREVEAIVQHSADDAQAFIDMMDETLESLPASGDATSPGNSVDVKRPPMLTKQLPKKVSRELSVQDIHREGGGEVPTRDVRAPPPLSPLPPPTIGGNERPSRKGTLAVGSGTTDESPQGSRLSANCMYSMFSRFAGLKSIN